MGGTTLNNVVSGNVILIEDVTGDVEITAVATEIPPQVFSVTFNGTNCTSNGSSTATEKQSYTATITPNTDYIMDTITVTMGGATLTDVVSGNTITIPNVTGNIVITAVAVEKPVEIIKYNVTFNGTNCTSNGASEVEQAKTYTATITPNDGEYEFVMKSVTITMGGTDITSSIIKRKVVSGVETEYDFSNISIPNVTGDIVITAVATDNLLEVAYGRDDLSTSMASYSQEVFTSIFGGKGYAQNYRASNSKNGMYYNRSSIEYVSTGLIPLGSVNDVFYVQGFERISYVANSNSGYFNCWDATGTFINPSVNGYSDDDKTIVDATNYIFTIKRSSSWNIKTGTAYIRLTFGVPKGSIQSVKRKKA